MPTSSGPPPTLGMGRAGPLGKDVRSDLCVAVEEQRSGGVDLQVNSKVDLYYGESIRELTLRVLEELGVEHAVVSIEDQGALPFTISARIETAVRRMGLGKGRKALPPPLERPGPSSKKRTANVRENRMPFLPGERSPPCLA